MQKKNNIHPTAIIHENAQIGERNYIGPYCLIGPNVKIGSDNHLEAYVAIGTPAEHRDYFLKEPGLVHIGSRNIFREYVNVTGGTTGETTLKDDIAIQRGCYIGHDDIIESKVSMSCNVLIGGHTTISEGANLGLSAVIHQHRIIGAYSMIGMNSSVTRNIPPFIVAFGTPCHPQKVNRIGLLRNGITEEELNSFENWFYQMKGFFEEIPPINHPFNGYIIEFEQKRDKLFKLLKHTGS